MKKLLLNLIVIYKNAVSPFLKPRCRFYPTCSCYSYEAIDKFGIKKGIWLAFKRIIKCHPFGKHGVDLVP